MLSVCIHNIFPTSHRGFRVFQRLLCTQTGRELQRYLHLLSGAQTTNMERTSSIRRKTITRQRKAEVMIAGEQLRYARPGV